MKTTTVQKVMDVAKYRKDGYIDAVFSVAKRDGDLLTLTDAQWNNLRQQFRITTPNPITFKEEITNLEEALLRWVFSGFKVADTALISDRRKICNSCTEWSPDERLGLGKCKKCGCTALKWWLLSEKCPLGKWIK